MDESLPIDVRNQNGAGKGVVQSPEAIFLCYSSGQFFPIVEMGLVSHFEFVFIYREFKNALEAKLKLSHRIARGVRAIAARKTLNRRVGIAVVVSLALLL